MHQKMKNFEELKQQWQNQPDMEPPDNGAEVIVEKTNKLKKDQRITNIVLGTTVVVLIVFFFYVKAYLAAMAALGMGMMIGGLIARILLEYFNLRQLKRIDVDSSFEEFRQKIVTIIK